MNNLRKVGLRPKVTYVADDNTAKGYVTGTSPAKNIEVAPDSEVIVYVSSGPAEGIAVPQVIDKSLEAAKAEILAAGLTVGEVTAQDDSTKAENVVIETSPPARCQSGQRYQGEHHLQLRKELHQDH